VNDKDFYGFFYRAWPESSPAAEPGSPLAPYLCPAWILLDRTSTTKGLQKKFRLLPRLKTRATAVDVATMYETASMVVNLEYALNLITLVAVLILFFIIQVGVVNTLRMTIRERTREIGTMRAIGMRRRDVRNLFLIETFFLSLISGALGVALAFAGMWLLRQIPFQADSNPLSMLLVNERLHFRPSVPGIGAYLLLILLIAAATAWFPARRAARLAPSDALRHFA
jgi:ABC-type antimicrobial peptide transport system permease subunit